MKIVNIEIQLINPDGKKKKLTEQIYEVAGILNKKLKIPNEINRATLSKMKKNKEESIMFLTYKIERLNND